MRFKVLAALAVLTLSLSAPSPSQAATYTGTIAADDVVLYSFNPGDGQIIFTLVWETPGTELFLSVYCELGGESFGWGTGWGRVDRTARLEIGTLGTIARCIVAVSSFRGSAPYTLNAQSTRSQGLTRTATSGTNDGVLTLTLEPRGPDDGIRAAIDYKKAALRETLNQR